MKKVIALAITLLPLVGMAQDANLKTVTKNISQNLVEKYTVSKDTKSKEGLYMILDADGRPLARGIYKNNQRQGVWSFFDQSTKVVQCYDYSKGKLTYLDQLSDGYVSSDFIVNAPEGAKVSPPVKIGGETLAVLSFIKKTDIPENVEVAADGVYLTYNIEVSETGKIGNVYLQYKNNNGVTVKQKVYYNANSGVLDCVPATINGVSVKSNLLLSAFVSPTNTISHKTYFAATQTPGGLPRPAGVGYSAPAYSSASGGHSSGGVK